MPVERTNRSQRMRDSLWLWLAADPLLHIARLAGRECRFREAMFVLEGLEGSSAPEHSLAFSWRHLSGVPLPSLNGTITVSRFGPFVNITVSAQYAYGSDVASLLAHDVLGDRCGAAALRLLTQLLRSILPVPRPMPRSG